MRELKDWRVASLETEHGTPPLSGCTNHRLKVIFCITPTRLLPRCAQVHGVDYYAGAELADPDAYAARPLDGGRLLRGPRPEEGEQAAEGAGPGAFPSSSTGIRLRLKIQGLGVRVVSCGWASALASHHGPEQPVGRACQWQSRLHSSRS